MFSNAASSRRDRDRICATIFGDPVATGFDIYTFPNYGSWYTLTEPMIQALMKTNLFKFCESFMLQYISGLFNKNIMIELLDVNH
jgi:hypothetical protein